MSTARKNVFRLAAVLLGLSVFVIVELICRLGGLGSSAGAHDAFSEFASVRPLFKLDANSHRYRVAENRRAYFSEESFPAQKDPSERRIFIFGGSTVQGRPYSIPTAFSTFLEIGLQHAASSHKWEVVNCGGISYASYRLLPIMEECLAYEPDLYIVCTGHNEFLECITYANVKQSSAILLQSHSLLSHLHSFQAVRHVFMPTVSPAAERPAVLPEEVDAILDHQGGLEMYSRQALHRDEVVYAFGENIRRMIQLSKENKIPLLLMTPPSNLRDCPPFKSEFSAATSVDERKTLHSELNLAGNLIASDPGKAVRELRRITEKNEQFAFSWYLLGRALMAVNRPEEAQTAFMKAQDEDVCPLRMTTPLRHMLQETAETYRVPMLDLHSLLAKRCRDGIVGDAVLVDHIHPSFRGHQQIGLAIIETLISAGFTSVENADYLTTAQAAFDTHLQSLENMYFLRGQRTLQSLKAWTEGRADGPPLTERDLSVGITPQNPEP